MVKRLKAGAPAAGRLMLLEADDIEFTGLPPSVKLTPVDGADARFQVVCPNCGHANKARSALLGKRVRCPKCEHDFIAEWGEPVAT